MSILCVLYGNRYDHQPAVLYVDLKCCSGGQVSGKSLEEVTLELARAIDRYLET